MAGSVVVYREKKRALPELSDGESADRELLRQLRGETAAGMSPVRRSDHSSWPLLCLLRDTLNRGSERPDSPPTGDSRGKVFVFPAKLARRLP
jgi:hypothetical protein